MARRTVLLITMVAVAATVVAAGENRDVEGLAESAGWRSEVEIRTDGTVVPKSTNCSPVGTWYGSNEMGDELVITVTQIGNGRYAIVSDGVNETANGYGSRSTLRGELLALGDGQFRCNQIGTVGNRDTLDPNPAEDSKHLPVVVGMGGVLELETCSSMVINFTDIGIYVWGSEPFADEPFMTYPPCCGHFQRMLNDLW